MSAGRFATYLIVAFILVMGTAAYLILHTKQYRKLVFVVLGSAWRGYAAQRIPNRLGFRGVERAGSFRWISLGRALAPAAGSSAREGASAVVYRSGPSVWRRCS